MGGHTTQAFAPARARAIAQRLNATLGGAAKSLLLSSGEAVGPLHELRHDLADEAAHGLLRRQPEFSAATVFTPAQRNGLLLLAIGAVLLLSIFPGAAGVILTAVVLAGYLANGFFRVWLFWIGSERTAPDGAPATEISDDDLPTYTVLVPLYRETNVLPQLAAALRALDYPGIR